MDTITPEIHLTLARGEGDLDPSEWRSDRAVALTLRRRAIAGHLMAPEYVIMSFII
jgi:hypothetical protein